MKITRSALFAFSAQQMYQIIADIEAYPEFLGWCQQAEIQSQSEHSVGLQVVAELILQYAKQRVAFTTLNTNIPAQSISMQLVKGPFSSFSGQWLFSALREDACKVEFELQFEANNLLTKKMVNSLFSHIANSQIDAFEQRAQQLYG